MRHELRLDLGDHPDNNVYDNEKRSADELEGDADTKDKQLW